MPRLPSRFEIDVVEADAAANDAATFGEEEGGDGAFGQLDGMVDEQDVGRGAAAGHIGFVIGLQQREIGDAVEEYCVRAPGRRGRR